MTAPSPKIPGRANNRWRDCFCGPSGRWLRPQGERVAQRRRISGGGICPPLHSPLELKKLNGRLGAAVDVELVIDLLEMPADGFDSDVEFV